MRRRKFKYQVSVFITKNDEGHITHSYNRTEKFTTKAEAYVFYKANTSKYYVDGGIQCNLPEQI